jgi:protein-disulfide reductase (glutathione)
MVSGALICGVVQSSEREHDAAGSRAPARATILVTNLMSSPALILALALALVACEASSIGSAPAPSEAPVEAKHNEDRASKEPSHIAWGDAIAWRDWDGALRAAKAENKSVCLVVYAEWCPMCKELGPEFARPDVAHAAEPLIMVRQDQDKAPPWLKERFGQYGDYLPRVLFLDPNGEVRTSLQSGHPRYPYFYAPLVTDRLIANMRAASEL